MYIIRGETVFTNTTSKRDLELLRYNINVNTTPNVFPIVVIALLIAGNCSAI